MAGEINATILAVNSGSSSLKVSAFAEHNLERLLHVSVDAIGAPKSELRIKDSNKRETVLERRPVTTHAAAFDEIVRELGSQKVPEPQAVSHRVVHGGPTLTAPVVLDKSVLETLKTATPFAPLHLPSALTLIERSQQLFPRAKQIACFDTGFHRELPDVAKHFAIPHAFFQKGIRRFGFHGLSYEYLRLRLADDLGARTVFAHLGSGASLAAVRDGKSVDTSMGLTPTGGIVMGTRSGDLDPGVVLHLLRTGHSIVDVQNAVEHDGGLKGLSGIANDMQVLLESPEPRAALAIEIFCYSARKQIGAYAAVLGGLDMLVFTGGIGEHAVGIRTRICEGLAFLGIELDELKNAAGEERISRGPVAVRVLSTDEEYMLAWHASRL